MKSFVMILLLGCSSALGIGVLPETELEPIHLFKMSRWVVSIGVATTGYTSERSFRVDVTKDKSGRFYTMRIVRIQRDEGKAMPMPMVITYKLEDLKIDPRFVVKVENPFCIEED